jgi:pimeloyl-ACP methyl ester carboxylesterase
MTRRALLIHGLSSSPAAWWRVEEWLEEAGYTTDAIALRGHGGMPPASDYALGSYIADVAPVRPADGGSWDLVVAHSLGGAIATVVAASAARWTTRLVLLDPVWRIPSTERDAVLADQLNELGGTAERLAAEKPHWHERDRTAKLDAIAQVDPEAVRRTFTDTGDWDVRADAARLTVPTLVLAGDPGVFAMITAADALAAPVDYRPVADAGHSPHRDRPEATRELLLDWLAGRVD